MAKVGRPPKVPEPDMPALVDKFAQYIEDTDIPIIAEFAYQNDLTKVYMSERKEFSNLIKKCLQKKESALERGMLTNTLNVTGAIFSLKQPGIGWTDSRQEKVVFVDPKTLSDDELKKLISDGS